ncbi:hypothetical protein ACUNV4_18795 [Granulosicoccus sp. 3-233]|uniref:hypothetical protein n=1 Tax=Granulosicoccus sp. 3-233 TaxID=3417969 RepID=UPI003D35752D
MYKGYSHNISRFAWLTPLSGHLNNNGPWLLVDEKTSTAGRQHGGQSRKVTHSCLLQMMSDVLDVGSSNQDKSLQASWTSACGRFSVNRDRGASDDSRLFVQRPEDYFLRIELRLDGDLLVAFQEPVWPHLQSGPGGMSNHLSIPIECLDALESGALASTQLLMGRRKSIASAA